MAIVKGQNLRLFVGSRAIAAALDCQLQVQLNVTPYSTKDDEGSFTKNRVVSLQWSVTANAIVVGESFPSSQETDTSFGARSVKGSFASSAQTAIAIDGRSIMPATKPVRNLFI